jgi:tRNA pseudouridine13 synthase
VHLTADLPGTGGLLRVSPEDFVVEEIPAYAPSGEGDHTFVEIVKRDLTTPEAIRRIAAALGVREGDVGAAGMKDRHAVTRQWLSLPPPVTPERARSLTSPDLSVVAAARHPHKLRTGHLRGNRFVLRIRGVTVPAAEAARRAEAILAALARPPGAPNWYGEQRFGRHGDNAARGRAILRGERPSRPPRDPREKRFLVSSYQSELFNRYLEQRMKDGLYARVLQGDVLRKVATGGLFVSSDPAVDQPRLDAGEVTPTGPMFGHAVRPSPPEDGEAGRREAALLREEGISPADFARLGRLAEGTRRPIGVPLSDHGAIAIGDDGDGGAIELRFVLPPGAYATVIAAEVIKTEPRYTSDTP